MVVILEIAKVGLERSQPFLGRWVGNENVATGLALADVVSRRIFEKKAALPTADRTKPRTALRFILSAEGRIGCFAHGKYSR